MTTPFIEPGATIAYANRVFLAVEVAPYTRRSDGAASQLVTWQSRCAVCDALYEVKGSRQGVNLPITCPVHRGQRRPRKPSSKATVRALRRLMRAATRAIEHGKPEEAHTLIVGGLEISRSKSAVVS